jgi:hypothetical protein
MTALFDVVTVHCFWAWCGHVERGLDPQAVHDQMEAHYAARHADDLAGLTGPWVVTVIPGAHWVIR